MIFAVDLTTFWLPLKSLHRCIVDRYFKLVYYLVSFLFHERAKELRQKFFFYHSRSANVKALNLKQGYLFHSQHRDNNAKRLQLFWLLNQFQENMYHTRFFLKMLGTRFGSVGTRFV